MTFNQFRNVSTSSYRSNQDLQKAGYSEASCGTAPYRRKRSPGPQDAHSALPTNGKSNDLDVLAHEQLRTVRRRSAPLQKRALSITSQNSGQSTFSALPDREITQQFPVRPWQQGVNSASGFIRQATKTRTSNQVENRLLDSRHPSPSQLEGVPFHVDSGHITTYENHFGVAVEQAYSVAVARRRHNRGDGG